MYTAEGDGVRGYFLEGEKFVIHPRIIQIFLHSPPSPPRSWPKEKNDNLISLTEESKIWVIL